MSTGIVFSHLTEELYPAYCTFASATFGPDSYQASSVYLDWLYKYSPLSNGYADCRLAVKGNKIVGCIHRMRMSWKLGDQLFVVPSIHNTMVVPKYQTGVGGLLIAQAMRGEPYAFVPGAEGAVADILRRLGFSAVPQRWWVKWLRPASAILHLAGSRLGIFPSAAALQLTAASLTDAEIDEMLDLANLQSGIPAMRQVWTRGLFRWRFAHPYGPRAGFVRSGKTKLTGYAIITLGWRRGLVLARVIEWNLRPGTEPQELFYLVTAWARDHGAHLIFVGSGVESLSARFQSLGWRSRQNAAQAFLRGGTGEVAMMPSVGDYGLESFASR